MPVFQPEAISIDGNQAGLNLDPVVNANGLASYAGVAYKYDNTSGGFVYDPAVPALQATLTVSLQKPSKTSKITKSRLKLVKPEPLFDAGVATTSKSHENSVDITFMFSEKSSQVEREHMLKYAVGALQNYSFLDVVVSNKTIY